ncbi:tetratricopeptide repeat protein [Colwellia sp. 1_MG-2023]|uniref:tetratricopeptide repeat protein n=1 Tax=Colwellia sp. 1_MG-2023 TaxID=3062649 RepID=UPI0026E403B3|nr:tetratricopeptide repeat protein [Colwellia sp. 1_MG-2023]MDO6445505.1 tetratricopeptide repeat protein [Colwellia sp. 1_MG-2023]
MRFNTYKQLVIGLFFIVFSQNILANKQDSNQSLQVAQQLLAEEKFDQSFKLFEALAKNNHSLANMTLGLFYKLGWGKVEKNNSQACHWFYQAALSEIPQAQKEFADCINFNYLAAPLESQLTDVESLPSYWYKKAFENGLHDAGCDIGRLYLDSKWQNQDIKKVIEWCTPAAERSAVAAQITLGDAYVLSSPLQNVARAEYWYQQAVQRNSGQAAFKLANLYYSMVITQQDDTDLMEKAVLMMETSSSLKYAPSYEKTAAIYWRKLATVDAENASSVLAKSYLWAKTAYQVNPSQENLDFLMLITNEMPESWQPKLDEQVNNFLD